MIRFIGWLFIGGMATFLTGCPTECLEPAYQFSVTAHVRPETDSLFVGDTVWIESTASTTMRDRGSGQNITFGNAANFGSIIRMAVLDATSDTLIDAVSQFTSLPLEGRAYTVANAMPARALQFEYIQIKDQYRFRLALICRQKGVFALFIGNAVNVHQQGKSVCEGASINIGIDNNDKHLSYLQNLYYKSRPIEETEKQSAYCFSVH